MTNCKFCNEVFGSRNAVFRHLRSSISCYDIAIKSAEVKRNNNGDDSSVIDFLRLEKRKVAIQFGYHISDNLNNNTTACFGNEVAAEIVVGTFFRSLRDLYPSLSVEEGEEGETTFSLASAAKLRHPSLMQENTCSGWGDVIGINYKVGGPQLRDVDFKRVVCHMQEVISMTVAEKNNIGLLSFVKVLNIQTVMLSTKFHAEQSCTQRSYHYLIPLHWIDNSTETLEWVINKATTKYDTSTSNESRTTHKTTPPSLTRFKKILKLLESRDVTKISSSVVAVSSAGRFGDFWKKERRPFHNFCDPSLGSGGIASPSNENVWRSVDKACYDGFIVDSKNKNEAYIVTEFRGDGFLQQQVRRMVATVIAISNGLLPEDFVQLATNMDISIETPIAPSDLIYFCEARFHFVDLSRQGLSLFETQHGNDSNVSWLSSLQTAMLKGWAQNLEMEVEWLNKLRDDTSPRILSALEQIKLLGGPSIIGQIQPKKEEHASDDNSNKREFTFSVAPNPYRKTLSLLHGICGGNNEWPKTSDSISRVIRSHGGTLKEGDPNLLSILKSRTVLSKFQGHFFQCGSFTIVNPQIFKGKLPTTNKQFPELVKAIFELESHICSKGVRSCLNQSCYLNDNPERSFASTHCMVNRNVEFTPHFLNGKGKIDTITIVGLGDYIGGEFNVDDKSYSIRYEALQYDGWKQFHSTSHFQGEQFSLIWFTPEIREDLAATIKEDTSFEDSNAMILIDKHSLLLPPSYPRLLFRKKSTDALVINEILDTDGGCAYELPKMSWFENGFSLKAHDTVLDIGAHIGVFCRYALSIGCKKIIAYEPEVENLKLLEHNLKRLDIISDNEAGETINIYKYAVAHGEPSLQNFVCARNRTDGTLNTWRHSLERYSSYIDKKGDKSISKDQDELLTRSQVQTVPFFGDNGALRPGVTFVKIDSEGGEIGILLSPESSHRSNWLDVTNLVFEWSFTKERRVTEFHRAVKNLESAGFNVTYEGQGSWWDTEASCMWPYHTDLIVFARIRGNS
jgi:FkbM family methyltransferase